jgi:hypothetical protein
MGNFRLSKKAWPQVKFTAHGGKTPTHDNKVFLELVMVMIVGMIMIVVMVVVTMVVMRHRNLNSCVLLECKRYGERFFEPFSMTKP